jgi:hypothetical protein
MAFPKTMADMERQGYRRIEYSRCKGCFDSIEWWQTPMGERIPMDPMAVRDSAAITHFSTCKQVDLFRKPPQPVRRVPKPNAVPQPMLFSEPITQAEDYDGQTRQRGKR